MQRGTPKVKCSQLLAELFWHIRKVVNVPFFYGSVIFWGKPSLSFLCLFWRDESMEFLFPFSFQCFVAVSQDLWPLVKMVTFELVDDSEKAITPNLSFQFQLHLKKWFLRDSSPYQCQRSQLVQKLPLSEGFLIRRNAEEITHLQIPDASKSEKRSNAYLRIHQLDLPSCSPGRQRGKEWGQSWFVTSCLSGSRFSFRNLSSNQKLPLPPFLTGGANCNKSCKLNQRFTPFIKASSNSKEARGMIKDGVIKWEGEVFRPANTIFPCQGEFNLNT